MPKRKATIKSSPCVSFLATCSCVISDNTLNEWITLQNDLLKCPLAVGHCFAQMYIHYNNSEKEVIAEIIANKIRCKKQKCAYTGPDLKYVIGLNKNPDIYEYAYEMLVRNIEYISMSENKLAYMIILPVFEYMCFYFYCHNNFIGNYIVDTSKCSEKLKWIQTIYMSEYVKMQQNHNYSSSQKIFDNLMEHYGINECVDMYADEYCLKTDNFYKKK